MSDFNKFILFFKLMGYHYEQVQINNKIYVRADDSKSASIVETLGYERICFFGIFDVDTDEAYELYNVSHVAHWPDGAVKIDKLIQATKDVLEDETE